MDCGDEVSEWLTLFLKKKCRLLRQDPNVTRKSMLSEGILLFIFAYTCTCIYSVYSNMRLLILPRG